MARSLRILVVSMLVLWQFGCGGGSGSPTQAKSDSPGPGQGPDISISPTSANTGSPDLTLTVTGSQQFPFTSDPHKSNQVVWSTPGGNTLLDTTFVSSSQLTAIIPESLLFSPNTAQVRVEIRDDHGGPDAKSGAANFRVVVPTPAITSISPTSVPAGSGDVRLIINGSNFGHYGHFYWSSAFWTSCGSLHDCGAWLQTSIISSSQLEVVIPAELLGSPVSVQIVVMNGDIMGMSDGYFGYPKSNSASFNVSAE